MEIRVCKECGNKFVLTDGEIAFFERTGLTLPKRCKSCRQQGKANSSDVGTNRPVTYVPDAGKTSRSFSGIAIFAALIVILLGALIVGGHFVDNPLDTPLTIIPGQEISLETEIPAYEIDTTEIHEAAESDIPQEPEPEGLPSYTFRNRDLREEHFEKHGVEMGFGSASEYEIAASAVVVNPDSLHKLEAEDGDVVYYLESTNEFVIVSTDGYIRTYFCPEDGMDYFNRQ